MPFLTVHLSHSQNGLLFTLHHSQSLLQKALPPLRGFLLLVMRLQDAMLIFLALPTYIPAGRFSGETEKSPQECTSELIMAKTYK